jgi:DNA-binding MarR family transcriptional regulator
MIRGLDPVSGLLFQLMREMRGAIGRRAAKFDITPQQAFLLVRTLRRPEASPSDLSAEVGTDNAGMTRLVDRLEAKGLVARRNHPGDRRSIMIDLTDSGRELAPNLGPMFAAVERQLIAGFSDEEVSHLKALLRRLLANLREAPG